MFLQILIVDSLVKDLVIFHLPAFLISQYISMESKVMSEIEDQVYFPEIISPTF